MRRLDGVSAFMVYNDVPNCYQHTLKIMILDFGDEPGGYVYDRLYQSLTAWMEQLPLLKWKLATVPLGLNHPEWIQDLEFEPSYHLRRIACPAPGDKATFNKLVSQLYAQTLDRHHPLWMTWIVEGLETNRVAMVAMFHHAYMDGAGASLVLQTLIPDGNRRSASSRDSGVDPERNPGTATLLLRGLVDLPRLFVREVPALIRMIRENRRIDREFAALGKEIPPRPGDAPDSPLNSVFSPGRSFSYESFRLADVTTIARLFGVTINDLLIAIVCGALQRYYRAGNHRADKPLLAGIPVGIRTEAQKNEIVGNFVSNSFVWVPIQVADPRQRLQIVTKSSRVMKEYLQATGGAGLLRAAALLPPAAARLMQMALRRRRGQLKALGNVGISNVRGPTETLRLGGGRVATWLSIGQVLAGVGLNITGWSYTDQFNICLMADRKVIPDAEVFARYLREAFVEYLDTSNAREAVAAS